MDTESLELAPEGVAEHPAEKLDGIVIGVLVGFDDAGLPLVVFPGNAGKEGRAARSTAVLSNDDVGREVALAFEAGSPEQPLIIGRIHRPEELRGHSEQPQVSSVIDGERVEFNADREIVLRCGKASITLTRAGKILIRGAYVLSRSSGANCIKGGSVHLN